MINSEIIKELKLVLSENDVLVLEKRLGLIGKPKTFKQVAIELKVSHGRCHARLISSLRKLQHRNFVLFLMVKKIYLEKHKRFPQKIVWSGAILYLPKKQKLQLAKELGL